MCLIFIPKRVDFQAVCADSSKYVNSAGFHGWNCLSGEITAGKAAFRTFIAGTCPKGDCFIIIVQEHFPYGFQCQRCYCAHFMCVK